MKCFSIMVYNNYDDKGVSVNAEKMQGSQLLYMYNVMLIWWRTPRSMLWPHPPPNKGRGCYKLVRVTLALIVLSACILVPVLFPFQEVLCRRTRRAGITCRRVVQSLCSYKAFSEPPLLFS